MQRYDQPQASHHSALLHFQGPDAADYLQRLSTVNVRRLENGHGAPGCFLMASGKMISHFTLWKLAPDEFLFELDAGREGHWKKALTDFIEQYRFTENFVLTDVSTLKCVWFFGDDQDLGMGPLPPYSTTASDFDLRFFHHGTNDFGRTWISIWGTESAFPKWSAPLASVVTETELESWRIEAVSPRVDFEISHDVNPLEVGLHSTIAENKGCYPGQEVIEKMISIGSPPRRLLKWSAETSGQLGALWNVAEQKSEIGKVTTIHSSQTHGLALVRKIFAKNGFEFQFDNEKKGKLIETLF